MLSPKLIIPARAFFRHRRESGNPGFPAPLVLLYKDLMADSALLLRLAVPSEATAIAVLSRELIECGLPWRWTPKRVAASIFAPDVNVLVACIHESIAGFAIMRYREDTAHLDLLAVSPPFRRLGIGRQLVEWLEQCAVVAGTFDVALEVRAVNKPAQAFYENIGYRTVAEINGYYEGVESALRMSRNLARKPVDSTIEEAQYQLSGFGVLRVPIPSVPRHL
jgi:ribosomal-protein-alanine N-acetyltransferase